MYLGFQLRGATEMDQNRDIYLLGLEGWSSKTGA